MTHAGNQGNDVTQLAVLDATVRAQIILPLNPAADCLLIQTFTVCGIRCYLQQMLLTTTRWILTLLMT